MTFNLQYIGTMLSGLSAFCCGKSRMHSRENKAMSVFCVNLMVGTMQFCTVTFLLVGWAWSLVWGIYMIILAGKKSNGYISVAFKNYWLLQHGHVVQQLSPKLPQNLRKVHATPS